MTETQALNLQFGDILHYTGTSSCYVLLGPRGGVRKDVVQRWRINGQTKRWKRQSAKFSIPIKHGLYAFTYLDNGNCALFHNSRDCKRWEEK